MWFESVVSGVLFEKTEKTTLKFAQNLDELVPKRTSRSTSCPPKPPAKMPMEEGGRFVPQLGVSANEGAAGTISYPTPLPMSVNPSTDAEIDGMPDYKLAVNGVIPGYAGHMPRARDKDAGSTHGGLNSNPFTPPEKRGPQKGCVREEDVIPERFAQYMAERVGVKAGYTGFRPGGRDVFNVTAYGNIPPDMETGMHSRSFEWRRVPQQEPPDFLDTVGGVVPKYTGHVPLAIEKHGTSHFGKTHPTGGSPVPLAQAGHGAVDTTSGTGFKDCQVAFATMPGYQGHIPQARDSYGTSYHHPPARK
jgi:hypothetical protein